ncbi:transcriptional activator HAC1, partial [Lecanoromycetidae sp. Uapishka_2]
MADTLSPAMAYTSEYYPPQATVSLSETSLENSLMTPEPTSPESSYVKSEMGDGDELRKPTKKRKSWGQELPTPKTNLPPRYAIILLVTAVARTHSQRRKRAKTEDEKEQRRIERVLRNRQAAQSSRERKRQEVEKLEGEKESIEQQNESLKNRLLKVEHEKFLLGQKVAKLSAQMEAYQRGESAPHIQLSPPLEPDLLEHDQIKQELDENPFSLPTPQLSLYATSTSYSSPSTATYSSSSTPATINLSVDDLTASPDMTQHPAAMFSLFATDGSVEDDLHFFKDGFIAPTEHDDIDANGFAFDSMVDLDACQSTTNNAKNNTLYDNNDLAPYSDVYINEHSFESASPSSQIAATSTAQQPFLGAAS